MNQTIVRIARRALVAIMGLMLSASCARAQQLVFSPFHSNGIYGLGDAVGWNVTVAPGSASPGGTYSYRITKNNLELVKAGSFELTAGKATIETSIDEPAMLYVTVDVQAPPSAPGPAFANIRQMDATLKTLLAQANPPLKDLFKKYPNFGLIRPAFPSFASFDEHRVATLGAAVAPLAMQPVVKCPTDFDSFWKSQLAALKKVPIHPELTPAVDTHSGVKLYAVKLQSVGSHVQGYLAVPARPGKFPALVIYQYAGVYALSPGTATNRASEGWLTFDVDAHDLPPSQGSGVPGDYAHLGDESRETSYFLKMYLRDTRAIDYIESRPDWDGNTIVVMGTSMGGQQSLVTAGLNPGRITAVIVNEPSGADSNGDLHGRRSGYPNWNGRDPQVMQTALYFDTVNFARHMTAPALVALGFIDTAAPPAGIWTEFDALRGPKEAIPMIESAHNNLTPQYQGAFLQRSEEVLATIVHGGRFMPDEAWKRYQANAVPAGRQGPAR